MLPEFLFDEAELNKPPALSAFLFVPKEKAVGPLLLLLPRKFPVPVFPVLVSFPFVRKEDVAFWFVDGPLLLNNPPLPIVLVGLLWNKPLVT